MGRDKTDELSRPGCRLPRTTVILVTIVAVSITLAGGLLFRNLLSGNGPPDPKTAAIVDQLSLTQPNPTFVERATSLLEQAGYVVAYFPGEQVTVDFYRYLPTHGYDLIVLRVHSGLIEEPGKLTDHVSLFTAEPYSLSRYYDEQLTGRLGKSTYYEGAPPLFGITPTFIKYSMRGKFDDAIIIMMGCDGLRSNLTAEAFLERGARAFASWSKRVSASHTDAATERLLEALLLEGLAPREAVAVTRSEIGPDPIYGAELRIARR